MSNRVSKRAKRAKRREQEALHSPVPKGDPIVDMVLGKIAEASYEDSFELMSVLQAHIRGETYDVKDPDLRAEMTKARARAKKYDDAERKFNEDPVKFQQAVIEESRKLHPTKAHLEKDQAKGAKMYQTAQEIAIGSRRAKVLQMQWEMKHGPKEKIMVKPVYEMRGTADQQQPVMVHEEIRIEGLPTFYLKPGLREVPWFIAEMLRDKYRDQDAANARESLLTAEGDFGTEGHDLQAELNKVADEYGEGRQQLPLPAIAV